MREIVRTNDIVLISLLESLFKEAGIEHLVADGNMSILEGSMSMIPRRVLVLDEDEATARRLIVDAGLEKELRPAGDGGW
ncbi:DUF2007 domain-containing protein [Roseibium limicola]|uniref:DUF2007 domain-containing protein n=1 Tax=Roseibium limicola TaxID=2816037 RepID=A0A939EPU4_9HYPH|nr:DUF2007 domain-containing protein [Roseibium limicola]MBO0344899.1 DUF2007 domain-containing protein [Roseibium limicola]